LKQHSIVRAERNFVAHPSITKSDFEKLVPKLEASISHEAVQILKSLKEVQVFVEGSYVPAFL
jgi:hypothetical protein